MTHAVRTKSCFRSDNARGATPWRPPRAIPPPPANPQKPKRVEATSALHTPRVKERGDCSGGAGGVTESTRIGREHTHWCSGRWRRREAVALGCARERKGRAACTGERGAQGRAVVAFVWYIRARGSMMIRRQHHLLRRSARSIDARRGRTAWFESITLAVMVTVE